MIIKHLKAILANPRGTIFATRVEWEIFNRIFPHLQREKDHGYPFSSDTEMSVLAQFDELRECLDLLDAQTKAMPKAYGKAFRYIMCRDLNRRLRMYANLAQWRISPKLRVAKYA
jgi:hypothetical protein